MEEKIKQVIQNFGFIIDNDKKCITSNGQRLKTDKQQQLVSMCRMVTANNDLAYQDICDIIFPKQKIDSSDNYNFVGDFANGVVISEALFKAYDSSKIDERDLELYNRFKLCFDNRGHIAYFVRKNVTANEWVFIPNNGNSVASLVKDLKDFCSQLEPDNPDEYHSFADELDSKFNDYFKSVLTNCYGRHYKDPMLHKMLAENLPNSFLRHSAVLLAYGRALEKEINNRKLTMIFPTEIGLYTNTRDKKPIGAIDNFVQEEMFKKKNNFKFKTSPKILSNDPNEPAFHYVDLDAIVEKGDCPTWDFYLRRFPGSQPKVLCAFVWSIFNAKNQKRQMLYLLDRKGGSGKSLLINCIASVMGGKDSAIATIDKDSLNDKFAASRIYGRPLTVMDDNKNPYLLASGRMHSILSHGYMPVEYKGEDAFSAKIDTSVIVAGNTMLKLDTGAIHEKSRVIILTPTLDVYSVEELSAFYETVEKDGELVLRRDRRGDLILKGDAHFQDDLLKEFKQFLYRCRECYRELCTTDMEISLPDDVYDILFDSSDLKIDIVTEVIRKYFKFEEGSKKLFTPVSTVSKIISIMNEADEKVLPEKFKVDDFKDFVAKQFRVVLENSRPRCRINDKEIRPQGFYGIALTAESYKRLDSDDYACVLDPEKETILEDNNIMEV